ncbi:MAG: hypothetical protein PHF67_00735 [Candidatus Nanoarchaeia archaeon]|nr:hypothetical protein [Candidatus Nanoarchaeia archaeon]
MTDETSECPQYRGYLGDDKLIIVAEKNPVFVLARCYERHRSALIWRYGNSGKLDSLDLLNFDSQGLTPIVQASIDETQAAAYEVPETVYRIRPTLRGQPAWRTYFMLLTSGHALTRELVDAMNHKKLTDEMSLGNGFGLTQIPAKMDLGRVLRAANQFPHRVMFHKKRLEIGYSQNHEPLSWTFD